MSDSELGPSLDPMEPSEADDKDPLRPIEILARAHCVPGASTGDRIRLQILAQFRKLGHSKHKCLRKILDRGIRCEDENIRLRTENRALEERLDALRTESLTDTPRIPATGPVAGKVAGKVTATEIISLYERFRRTWNPRLDEELSSKLSALDTDEGTILYETCLRSQTADAMYLTGECCDRGFGTERDAEMATLWYQRASNLGDATAMWKTAFDLQTRFPQIRSWSGETDPTRSKSPLRDESDDPVETVPDAPTMHESLCEAFRLYQESAHRGHPRGMYHLGHCFEVGIGTAKHMERAVEWWTKSADLGETLAMNDLGTLYDFGKSSIAKDQEKAVEWYTRSALAGDGWGACRWARSLQNGHGDRTKIPTFAKCLWRHYHSADMDEEYEGQGKHEIRSWIDNIVTDDHWIEILEWWIREQDENVVLRARNQALPLEIEELTTELEYRPGGPGYASALTDFETLAGYHPPVPLDGSPGVGLDA